MKWKVIKWKMTLISVCQNNQGHHLKAAQIAVVEGVEQEEREFTKPATKPYVLCYGRPYPFTQASSKSGQGNENVAVLRTTPTSRGFFWIMPKPSRNGANAVSHLNHINARNVSKLYIIRQFITCKLQ